MNVKLALVIAAALAATACAATPAPGPSAAVSGPRGIPNTPLQLGEWREGSVSSALEQFRANVTERYAAGLPLNEVTRDLGRAEFRCGAAPEGAGGAPPAQVCRRAESEGDCTHTWQVLLYGSAGTFDRARPLYDRHCGDDGLLGGPS
jgi:hypothetical protein